MYYGKLFHILLLAGFISKLIIAPTMASDIIYTPINPSFGGNSFNSSHLLGLANAQNEPQRKADEEAALAREQSTSDRFIQLLQSRLYSGLAQQVSEAIFGENSQQQGTIQFDDQEISWINTGTEIQLYVSDAANGQLTEIVIPTITQ
ncbi:MAG: curli assembly protein CsgF [Hyphomicrobiales bacterium]|nr:curli assembly protein CsgF [Hyphomicrobiales bacterium]